MRFADVAGPSESPWDMKLRTGADSRVLRAHCVILNPAGDSPRSSSVHLAAVLFLSIQVKRTWSESHDGLHWLLDIGSWYVRPDSTYAIDCEVYLPTERGLAVGASHKRKNLVELLFQS